MRYVMVCIVIVLCLNVTASEDAVVRVIEQLHEAGMNQDPEAYSKLFTHPDTEVIENRQEVARAIWQSIDIKDYNLYVREVVIDKPLALVDYVSVITAAEQGEERDIEQDYIAILFYEDSWKIADIDTADNFAQRISELERITDPMDQYVDEYNYGHELAIENESLLEERIMGMSPGSPGKGEPGVTGEEYGGVSWFWIVLLLGGTVGFLYYRYKKR